MGAAEGPDGLLLKVIRTPLGCQARPVLPVLAVENARYFTHLSGRGQGDASEATFTTGC